MLEGLPLFLLSCKTSFYLFTLDYFHTSLHLMELCVVFLVDLSKILQNLGYPPLTPASHLVFLSEDCMELIIDI
jgi:hypothetical protein